MPRFGKTSNIRLNEAHPDLQRLFREVVKSWDCSILCGHRNERDQTEAFDAGNSSVEFPNSKHNAIPSRAVDVAPYPIDWNDLGRFYMFAGYVLRTAEEMGIRIRYGGDWDGDKKTTDQTFNDLPHFELL